MVRSHKREQFLKADCPNHSFTERDILMRYHWGMGIGHLHAHGLSEHNTHDPSIKISPIQYHEPQEEVQKSNEQLEVARELEENVPMAQLETGSCSGAHSS